MTSNTRESTAPESGAFSTAPLPSGMRPVRRGPPSTAPATRGASTWSLAAVLAWLLALTMVAVDTVRADFRVALAIAALQAGLILAFYMRFAWDRTMHLLLVGVGGLFIGLLFAAISADRTEYQPELDRFDTTVGGLGAAAEGDLSASRPTTGQ